MTARPQEEQGVNNFKVGDNYWSIEVYVECGEIISIEKSGYGIHHNPEEESKARFTGNTKNEAIFKLINHLQTMLEPQIDENNFTMVAHNVGAKSGSSSSNITTNKCQYGGAKGRGECLCVDEIRIKTDGGGGWGNGSGGNNK